MSRRISKNFSAYEDRNRELGLLGFDSYDEYLNSQLWDLIRRSVLYRDHCECRNLYCPNAPRAKRKAKPRRKQVHHLGYTRATLLGINPAALVTLCTTCHRKCEFCGKRKLTLEESLALTVQCVAGIKPVAGMDYAKGQRVGRFFSVARELNRGVARWLLERMRVRLPYWYGVVVQDVRQGRLPEYFTEYLNLGYSSK